MAILVEKMITALALCPCCKASRQSVNTPEDRIPEGKVHESVFHCGSRAFVDAEGMASVGIGCPYPMDDALYQIQERFAAEDDEVEP